jgi:hypothetical protein
MSTTGAAPGSVCRTEARASPVAKGGSLVLVVFALPAVLMIGVLLLERLERRVFMPPRPKTSSVSTSDTDATG